MSFIMKAFVFLVLTRIICVVPPCLCAEENPAKQKALKWSELISRFGPNRASARPGSLAVIRCNLRRLVPHINAASVVSWYAIVETEQVLIDYDWKHPDRLKAYYDLIGKKIDYERIKPKDVLAVKMPIEFRPEMIDQTLPKTLIMPVHPTVKFASFLELGLEPGGKSDEARSRRLLESCLISIPKGSKEQ